MTSRRLIDLSNGVLPPQGFLSQPRQQQSISPPLLPPTETIQQTYTPPSLSPLSQVSQLSYPVRMDLLNVPKVIQKNVLPEETMIQPQEYTSPYSSSSSGGTSPPPPSHPRSITTISQLPTSMANVTPDQARSVENAETRVSTNDGQHTRNKFSSMYEDMYKNGTLKIFYA